jgi:hypothetical protein
MGIGLPDFVKDYITQLVEEHGGTFTYRNADGSRTVVTGPGDEYPATECAKDMEAGINVFSCVGVADLDAMLNSGKIVMLPCPACKFEGRKQHMLTIKKLDGKFTVSTGAA